MQNKLREDIHLRLKRVEGQIAGIQRMVDSDRYCLDIVTQVSAARAALSRVARLLLAAHVETCVADALDQNGSGREKLAELVSILEKLDV